MSRADYRWVQKFNDLYETVERHMHMEEDELFGQARDVLTAQEAEELGRKVEVAKKDISGEAPAPLVKPRVMVTRCQPKIIPTL